MRPFTRYWPNMGGAARRMEPRAKRPIFSYNIIQNFDFIDWATIENNQGSASSWLEMRGKLGAGALPA